MLKEFSCCALDIIAQVAFGMVVFTISIINIYYNILIIKNVIA